MVNADCLEIEDYEGVLHEYKNIDNKSVSLILNKIRAKAMFQHCIYGVVYISKDDIRNIIKETLLWKNTKNSLEKSFPK